MSGELDHRKVALADGPLDVVEADFDLLFTLTGAGLHFSLINFDSSGLFG